MSVGGNSSNQTSSSSSISRQTTPEQLSAYYDELDAISGHRVNQFAEQGGAEVTYTPVAGNNQVTARDVNATKVAAPNAIAPQRVEAPAPITARDATAGPVDTSFLNAPTVNYQGVGPTPTAQYEGVSPDQIRSLGGLGATRTSKAEEARRQELEALAADPSLTLAQRLRANQLTNDRYRNELDAIAKETEAAIGTMASTEAGRRLETEIFNTGNQVSDRQFDAGNALRAGEVNAGNELETQGRQLEASMFDVGTQADLSKTNAGNDLTAQITTAGNALDASKTNADNDLTAQITTAGNALDASKTNAANDLSAQTTNADNDLTAQITNLDALMEDALRGRDTDIVNRELNLQDIQALADLFFRGLGQNSQSQSRGRGSSSGFNVGFNSPGGGTPGAGT